MVNAFQFWNTNPFEIPLIVASCLYFTFIQRHIGFYLTKSSKIGNQILIGICASSGVLAFLISFSAVLGRIFIYFEGFLLIGIELLLLLKSRKSRPSLNHILITLTFFILVTAFAFLTVFRTFTPTGKLIVNAHQIYMSGLSIEILNSDYLTRIKILDNYPLVFEKFHFLNASMSAITMAPTLHFNYLTYVISKFIIFTVAALVGFELLSSKFCSKSRAFQTVALFSLGAFLVLPTSMVWASNTNNNLPIILIIAGLTAYIAGEKRSSLAYLLFFCISTSRSLIPGLTLLITIFVIHSFRSYSFKKPNTYSFIFQYMRNRLASDKSLRLLLGAFLAGLFSLVLTGYAPKPLGRKTLITTFTDPLKKLFPTDWLGVMSPGSFGLSNVIHPDTYYTSQNNRNTFIIYCFVTFVLSYFVLKSQIRNTILAKTSIFIIAIFYFVVWLILAKESLPTVFADYYLTPVLIILTIAPRRLRIPLTGFILASLAQIMLLGPDVAVPNWHLTEWIGISFVSIRLLTFLNKNRYLTVILSCCFLFLQFFGNPNIGSLFRQDGRDSTTHIITVRVLPVVNTTLKAWCHTNDNEDAIMAIRGNRIFANSNRSGRYTVTRDFIRERLKLQTLPSIDCKN